MRHLKGNVLAVSVAVTASLVIFAGLAVHGAAGAATDTSPAPTVVTGNPPAAPVEPPSTAPSTGVDPNGNQLGVNNGPGATGAQAGSSNLPTAGFGPNASEAGSLPWALVLLGAAGFVLVTAGAALSRKPGS